MILFIAFWLLPPLLPVADAEKKDAMKKAEAEEEKRRTEKEQQEAEKRHREQPKKLEDEKRRQEKEKKRELELINMTNRGNRWSEY